MCSAAGKWIAAPSTSPTTCGASRLRHGGDQRMGHPDMFEQGLVPELLLSSQYGHKLHFWDLHKRRHVQEIDLGPQAPARLRAAPGARPDQGLWLRQLRGQPGEPVGRRSGCGTATATNGRFRRSFEIRPSRPIPSNLSPALKDFKACPPSLPTSTCRRRQPEVRVYNRPQLSPRCGARGRQRDDPHASRHGEIQAACKTEGELAKRDLGAVRTVLSKSSG